MGFAKNDKKWFDLHCVYLNRFNHGIEGVLKNSHDILGKIENQIEYIDSKLDFVIACLGGILENTVPGNKETKKNELFGQLQKMYRGQAKEKLSGLSEWIQNAQQKEKNQIQNFRECLNDRNFHKIRSQVLKFDDLQLSENLPNITIRLIRLFWFLFFCCFLGLFVLL